MLPFVRASDAHSSFTQPQNHGIAGDVEALADAVFSEVHPEIDVAKLIDALNDYRRSRP